MNDEIKKILDYLRIENGHCSSELSYEETHLLLDYITNLQEENETLKELCDKYEEEHNTAFKLWKMKMKEMPTYKEKETLKEENERLNNRINTAIEYIEVNTYKSYETDSMDLVGIKELLKILNGGEE